MANRPCRRRTWGRSCDANPSSAVRGPVACAIGGLAHPPGRVVRGGARAASPSCSAATASARPPRCGRSSASTPRTGEVAAPSGWARRAAGLRHPPAGPRRPRLRAGGPGHLRRASPSPRTCGWPSGAGSQPRRYDRCTRSSRSWPGADGNGPARCPAAQQQMLAIGRVLLNDNRLLLVDEPTKGLAPKVVTEVADVLERVAESCPSCWSNRTSPWCAGSRRDAVVLAAGQVAWTGRRPELCWRPR